MTDLIRRFIRWFQRHFKLGGMTIDKPLNRHERRVRASIARRQAAKVRRGR